MANKRWAKISEGLKASSGHDFERKIFPLLRIKWSNLAHPSSLKTLDRSGIDLVLVGDGSPLSVVVQCKGFEIQGSLGDSQLDQIKKSIRSFLKSAHKCKTYLLVYNRPGIDQEFTKRVQDELQLLKDEGKAEKVLLWDLSRLGKELNKELTMRILQEIQRLAKETTLKERSQFLFGNIVLNNVPHSQGELTLRRHDIPKVSMSQKIQTDDPINLIANPNGRWTLVYGSFGSGKSTLSQRLSTLSEKQLLYVPASALKHSETGVGSENALTTAIAEYIGIFNTDVNFNAEETQLLIWLAGPLLAARLRDQDTNFILLIDAIDENRFYSSMEGFQVLINELSRAHCQVVLTTRKEHFRDHFLDYGAPLNSGNKFSNGKIQLVELHHWSTAQALEYIDSALMLCDQDQELRLRQFRKHIETGSSSDLALQHPLLLAMIVDLIAEEGDVAISNRAELYRRWTEQKLIRDLGKSRLRPAAYENTGQLVQAIINFMTDIALRLTDESGNEIQLIETIQESIVQELAEKRFGTKVQSDIYSTTSFLEPLRERNSSDMTLRFFHRSFHEYFLSLALHNQGLPSSRYPEPIRVMVGELSGAL